MESVILLSMLGLYALIFYVVMPAMIVYWLVELVRS